MQYIAKPFARFIPLDDNQSIKWKEEPSSHFDYTYLVYSLRTHKIDVISFDKDSGISTLENNKHIPIWNHQIYLEPVDEGTTRYSDEVEIGASWKTPFVALWAKAFYTHRQRKWKRLLRN